METNSISRRNLILIAFIISGFAFLTNQCFAQEVKKEKQNKPDVKIRVNREYDDKGNITRFDSTYSYSWSGTGEAPANIDSIFRGFNQTFGFRDDLDSMLNHMGFSWPFEEEDFFSQPFSQHKKQFEEFFRHNQFPTDSSVENSSNNFLSRDFQKMLEQHQELMDHFFDRFYLNSDSLMIYHNDSIFQNLLPSGKFMPDKQNDRQNSRTEKTISV